jgi:hypothetical protein
MEMIKNHEEEKARAIEALREGVSFQEILNKLPEEAFRTKPEVEVCSDGRVCPHSHEVNKAALAGQGILAMFSESELNSYIESLKKQAEKIKSICSHDHCGAANLAFLEIEKLQEINDAASLKRVFDFLDISELPKTPDELGKIFTKRLADEVGAEYSHIHTHEFVSEHHEENGIIISGKDIEFDARFLADNFFQTNATQLGLSVDYLKTELTKLTEIAFGHGRMGHHSDKYQEDAKFYLLVIAKPEEAESLRAVAAEVAANPEFKGKVVVEVAER